MSPKQIVVESIQKQQEIMGIVADTTEDLMQDDFNELQEYLQELIEANK